MRYIPQGGGFRVGYTDADVGYFNDNWPCSEVEEEEGWVEFDAHGDLVALGGDCEGFGWPAFIEDCRDYGLRTRSKENTMGRTFRVGSQWQRSSPDGDTDKYILAQVDDGGKVCMISLSDGNRWHNPISVGDPWGVTEEEFERIAGGMNDYTLATENTDD